MEDLLTQATGTEAPPDAAATPPEPATDAAQTPAPESEATVQTPEPEDWKAKLTPEQRREILRDADPREAIEANDRLQGHVGKLAQRQAQERDLRAAQERLDQAIKDEDIEGAKGAREDINRVLGSANQEVDQEQGLAAFNAAKKIAWDDAPDFVKGALKGKDYGQASGNNPNIAAYLALADYAVEMHKGLPAHLKTVSDKARKEGYEAGKKDALAESATNEPSPDLNPGAGPSRPQSDDDFLSDYAAGKSDDHTRARRLTGVR